MKRYNEYRLMDEQWIPMLPGNWDFVKMKYLFNERSEKGYPDEKMLVASQNMGVVPKDVYGKRTVVASKDLQQLKLVKKNDFVISLRSFQGGIERAYFQGIISPSYTILKGQVLSDDYFTYLGKSAVFIQLLKTCVTGIREGQNIDYRQLKNHKLPVPSRSEQKQIVCYLNWKISEINRFIEIVRAENELLKETINIQFKKVKSDTTTKLKRMVSLEYDPIDIKKNVYYQKTGMYNRGRGIFRRDPILGSEMGDSKFQKIHKDRIMISGQFAWEAAAYITTSEDEAGVASHRYYLLKPSGDICVEYIWSFLMSDVGQMEMNYCSRGAAGRNRPLNIKKMLNVEIPIPIYGEELDKLIKAVRAYMTFQNIAKNEELLLKELKTRLISDVVTGQIDVRDIEIPEYEYVKETADTDSGEMDEILEDEDEEV